MIKDYFLMYLIPEEIEGIRIDIAALINEDLLKYRNYLIKHYNGNINRATDIFCFKKFLNDYSMAINVFGLHAEYDCKGSFNKFISSCWATIYDKNFM